MHRRTFLSITALSFLLASACKKEARCKTCGMRIDPKSAWLAELVTSDGAVVSFDTPQCALRAWRSNAVAATSLRVHEYYDRAMRDAGTLRFVIGSDVKGPMGPDLVPVDPSRVSKFMQDHAGRRVLDLEEISLSELGNLE